MNKRIIPIIFLAAVFTVPAIVVQSAYAGVAGDPCDFTESEFCFQGPDTPQHTTISPTHGTFSGGVPIVYWGEPFMVTLDAGPNGWPLCNDVDDITSVTVGLGPFSDNIFEGGILEAEGEDLFFLQTAFAGAGASQPMTEIDPVNGIWKANFPALNPLHGNAVITYTWTCASTGATVNGPMEDGGIFMDPSGQVRNACTGQPIENAEVTLLSDHFGNPLSVAPFGSYIPAINPLFTDVNGLYAWDVQPGFDYQVSVVADLGTGADQDYVPQVSAVLPVPPPQTGIDFNLVPVNGCPAIGGEILSTDSTALLVAGTSQSFYWIAPILASVAIGIIVLRNRFSN